MLSSSLMNVSANRIDIRQSSHDEHSVQYHP